MTKHRDEDLGAVLAAGRRVNDRDGVARVIGLHHRTCLVAVAVPRANPALELPVTLAEHGIIAGASRPGMEPGCWRLAVPR